MIERFWKRRKEIHFSKADRFDYSLKEHLKKHDNEVEIFGYLSSLNNDIFVNEIRIIFNEDAGRVNNKIYSSLNKLNNDKNL